MFHIRARVEEDPTRNKHFWYRHSHNNWRMAEDGKPPAVLANRLLYLLPGLRAAIRAREKFIMWTEGEKDACAAGDMLCEAGAGWYPYHGPATSHHGGAGKATIQQAAHFRRYRGTVLIAADDDDPGYACALRRYELLREVGLPERRLRIVRAADEVGGGLGAGVDIADHVRAGYGLGDLVPVPEGALRAGAERWAASEQQGARYGASGPPLTAEEQAWVDNSPLVRNGWPKAGGISGK